VPICNERAISIVAEHLSLNGNGAGELAYGLPDNVTAATFLCVFYASRAHA
jgi:hypothetical protein